MRISEILNKRANVLYLVIILILQLLVKINGHSGLNIYSSLPEYVVEWLKRHIFFEIKYIKNEGKICSSGSGPYCKHIYRKLMREYNNLEDIWMFDDIYRGGEYGANLDYNKNSSPYLHIEYKIVDEKGMPYTNNHMEKLVMLDYSLENSLGSDLNIKNKVNNIIRTSENDFKALYTYCKLDSKRLFYCLKIVGRSIINNIRNQASNYTRYLKFETLIKLYRKYLRKRKFTSRLSKLVDYYYYIENYTLPDKDNNYQVNSSKEYNRLYKNDSVSIISDGYTNLKVPIDTGILFDDTFSKLLISKSIRTSLVSTLTWILDQKSAYIEIWNNRRNERLNRRYVIGTVMNNMDDYSYLNEYIASPFTKFRILRKDILFEDEFRNNFKIIRKTWNGVSLKMNFNVIKPNVKIIPSDFCNDNNVECKWEGVWEAYYKGEVGLRLLSKNGRFQINNEKFVISDFPITFYNPMSDEPLLNEKLSEYKNKYITISGYNGFILMWKSHISISDIISERSRETVESVEGEYFVWINALEFSNTIPYSLIDSIQIESDTEGVVIGSFVFNLLNPAYNYVSKSRKELTNIPIEVDQTSELSLVVNIDEKEINTNITTVSITTMYLSRASPLISLYNIQEKGLNLEEKISETTKCVIKRNLAELTTDN
ncbi:hypothetical protein FG386_002171 [Cryptosporidium ryanae]|uniref:uncharacterized protein n=1 Tax=Cryptosporidium ryanae TaxID=515981 RepID=UPI00351A2345|nr:hypothetical protein FG386_002171 [Cryptosporidium ryanae]